MQRGHTRMFAVARRADRPSTNLPETLRSRSPEETVALGSSCRDGTEAAHAQSNNAAGSNVRADGVTDETRWGDLTS